MIHCTMNRDATIIAPKLPEIGDMIHVKDFGHALVEYLYHTTHSNYIQLQFQETAIGRYSSNHPFEVKPNG